MKKTFEQLGKWILKHKKELIYGVLALFIGQICFFNLGGLGLGNEVFAVDNTPSLNSDFQKKATDWLQVFSFLERGCYILLYPILFLAGLLVNNSFVYAEVFGFDTVLWQLRNIVRNLANYALGFILLFKIFQYLTNGQKSGDLKKLLTSTLIAGIGIQASWFLLAVLIDISNVLTYSVGGLPIHILGKQKALSEEMENFGNPYVYQTSVYFNFDDSDTSHTYLTPTLSGGGTQNIFIAECKTFSYYDASGEGEELIVAPEIVYYYDGKTYYNTERKKCHVGDDVFNFADLDEDIEWQDSANPTWKDSQNKYMASVEKVINSLTNGKKDARSLVAGGIVLQIRNAHTGGNNIWTVYNDPGMGLDVNNEVNGGAYNMNRLQNILDGDDGYVGVFSALYSSLLNAGKDLKIGGNGTYTKLLNTLLSVCHTVAVGVPLLAMLIVFLMRIGVIWMAIVLSPGIILVKAFGWEDKMKNMDLLKYLTVSNLIGIIFSPAIICFAVSISTVLVRIISTVNTAGIVTKDTTIFGGLIKLNIESAGTDLGHLICSVIGVAISRFLIWSAVKASALGEKVKGLEKLAKTAIGSIPIIPVPGVNGEGVSHIGIDKAFGLNGQRGAFSEISSTLTSKYSKQDQEALNAWLNGADETKNAAKNMVSAYTRELGKLSISDISSGPWIDKIVQIGESEDPTKKQNRSFKDFNNSDRKEIIEAINHLDNVDQRKAFGDSLNEVTIGTEKYIFDGTENKYKPQSTGTSSST